MKIEDMSPGLLKAFKRFAQTTTKGGTTCSISVSGGPEVKIDKAAAQRISRNVDAELNRRKKRP